MMMQTSFKVAICDDEEHFLQEFSNMLKLDSLYTVDCYTSPSVFLSQVSNYDIVFIDYDMPEKNGLEILKEINHLSIIKIVITNYDYIVHKSLAFDLFSFIRKNRFLEDYMRLQDKLELYLKTIRKKIVFTSPNKSIVLLLNEIHYIETNHHYLLIHATKYYKIRSTFQAILPQFNTTSFLMPCYGVLINPAYIKVYNKKLSTILLNDNITITVSKSCKKEFMQKYSRYLANV